MPSGSEVFEKGSFSVIFHFKVLERESIPESAAFAMKMHVHKRRLAGEMIFQPLL